jgi:hypothetical protein
VLIAGLSVEGIQQMLAWDPSGIILSHGACYRKDATTEIAKAFGRAGSETEA